MGKWSREEIDQAFQKMLAVIDRYPEERSWDSWVDLLTEDAEYYDDIFEPRIGREAVRTWLNEFCSKYPVTEQLYYPCPWYIIDEERGWVVCEFRNRMRDPGDGKIYEQKNYSRYKYAGNMMWSEAEDQYNPAALAKMHEAWIVAKKACDAKRSSSDDATS